MTARDALVQLVNELSEDHVDRLLDYARFLGWKEEGGAWREFGRFQLAKAYGDDEPDYTESDLRKGATR